MVEIQEIAIILIISKFKVGRPLATPTPITAPTSVCVVEMGRPILEQINTTVAAANVAANPLEGVSSVIFSPMVAITLAPQTNNPTTMKPPPSPNI